MLQKSNTVDPVFSMVLRLNSLVDLNSPWLYNMSIVNNKEHTK